MKKSKQIIKVIVCLMLLVITVPFSTHAKENEKSTLTINEANDFIVPVNRITNVPAGYIGIYTSQDLQNIANNLSGNYIIMNDLNMDGAEYYPIGDDANSFKGVLDGNGYTISNLKINTSRTLVGLLGKNDGTVKNIRIADLIISGDIYTSGIVFGTIAGNNGGKIENCYFDTGSIKINVKTNFNDGGIRVGGIAGINNGSITNCYKKATIEQSSDWLSSDVGGIAGANFGNITNCYNNGNVTAQSSKFPSCAGGIIGTNIYYGKVNNCYNSGNIYAVSLGPSSYDSYAGGIAGYSSGVDTYPSISNCYNTGSISATSTGDSYSGGISGYSDKYGPISNCYNLGGLRAENTTSNKPGYTGGITGADYEHKSCYYPESRTSNAFAKMLDKSQYLGFDFGADWNMDLQSVYPFPTLKGLSHKENAMCSVHTWAEKIVVNLPSGTDGKINLYTCTLCGSIRTGDCPLAEHLWNTNPVIHQEPTCTQAGDGTFTCTVCKMEERQMIPPLGHDYPARWTIDKSPTYLEPGSKSRICKRCGEVEVMATPMKPLPFNDVTDEDWYISNVRYVYANQIMTGLTDDTFGGAANLSRAQFAVILHRMEGMPQVSYSPKFPDVGADLWYTDAIMWANEHSIVTGYLDGSFGINDSITREQMATMMYRFAKYKGYDTSASAELDFPDRGLVSDFALKSMNWAVGAEIISGNADQTLAPQGTASRAVCATIIQRFQSKFEEK